MFNQDLKAGLSIVCCNTARFKIDNEARTIQTDEVIFLTADHKLYNFTFDRINALLSNRPFHYVKKDDSEVGCNRLLIFWGFSNYEKYSDI